VRLTYCQVNTESIESLKAELAAARRESELLRQELQNTQCENKLLRQKLDALARMVFGRKSEKLDIAQMELLLGGVAPSVPVDAQEKKKPAAPSAPPRRSVRSQRIVVPENLKVVTQVIEPELVSAQPDQWKRIGEEVARRLDFQPGEFFWQETVRPKYVRVGQRELPPVIAPAPASAIDHGMAAPGLLARILVQKYCDHLPFYRQEQIFKRGHGVFISRQQMVQWTAQSVLLLSAVSDILKIQARQSGYLQVDETPVRYQDTELKGRCGQGYLWTMLVPQEVVVYEWHASRAAACLTSLLGPDFSGNLQCDGYAGYTAYAKDKPNLKLFGCWAHLRRGFFEAQEQDPKIAGWILNQIRHLYAWEQELREDRAGPALRQAHRRAHARMVVQRLDRALNRIRSRYLPKSSMGKAIHYALGHWPNFERFLDHGEVEIDNNLVENAIRPTAIGKKNWLFFGSEEAGQRSAVMYTLIENCRMHGIDPYAYLKDVLERLPTMTNQQVESLTPLNWQKEREAQVRMAA
jgi:transposase